VTVKTIPLPERLKHNQPHIEQLFVIGDPALLDSAQFALFCSVKCPASIILKTYDLAQQLKDKGIGVISGFHSPVEKEALVTLLRGEAPVIVCPARSISNMRVPSDWKPHIKRGWLLIISPFAENQNRGTQHTATIRNRLVAALAQEVFIAYAEPGGKTEAFALELIARGSKVTTFDFEQTKNLREAGAASLNL
jgi:predicted Rossmann fold nucleotide-binding protein DprA/Smf involved in DNA uptake